MDSKRRFKGMLARIFSDAAVDDAERAEIEAFIASGSLSHADVKDVVADFVATTWKITTADGVVSDVEKIRLRKIVDVLELVEADLPAEWVKALSS